MARAAEAPAATPVDGVLAIVRELAIELQPHRQGSLAVRLDSRLNRDLGFDSLARAELLLRLDRAFRAHLPEELIAEAETPQDLVDAVLRARPGRGRAVEPITVRPAAPSDTAEPVDARTLVEALAGHIADHGEREHILLWRREAEEEVVTYAGLDRAARAVAGGLAARGLEPGDRVAIMLPTEAGFFSAFFGALYAGGIPVPLYPPFRRAQLEDHLRRQAGILRNAEATILITNDEIHAAGELLHGLVASLKHVDLASDLEGSPPAADVFPAEAETTALIQYTSGSTGDPKGVVLTHANLMANIRAMGAALAGSAADTFVSWLPLYHDMGLIGAWLGCLYYGAPTVIMPPLAFLADPARWLWAIHRHRATLSAAPNFAFELCLKNVRDEDIDGLDLSSLKAVVNGAEPVSPSTIARFTERFEPFGFRPHAMVPVYGLAECSVGLAFPPLGRPPIIDRVDRDALAARGVAMPVTSPDRPAIEFVACGQPLPGHQIRIVDDAGRELPERREGRLEFKGPSATQSYFRDPAKTRALFDGEWLDSGDRAYVAGGDIYVTGRVKDIIIRAGRNIYPHELEAVVGAVDGVRRSGVAAFASRDPRLGTEHLVVVAETRHSEEAELDRLRQRIVEETTGLLDLPPDTVVLVPPRTVPKTSSGKVRRSEARLLYESGTLGGRPRPRLWQIVRLSLAGLVPGWRRRAKQAGDMAYAIYWWSLVCGIAVPLWCLVILLPYRSWRHAVVGGAARLFFRLAGLPFTVEREAPAPAGGTMIVANHASYLDGLALSAALAGELSFAAKAELAGQRVAGPYLRRLGALFVRRTDPLGGIEDTRATVAALKAGERVVSFPEGTLTRMPGLLGFRLGAFLAAAEAQAPVVPVVIRGTRSVLRGEQWFPRRGPISVHIGRPLMPEGGGFEAAVRLRNAARAAILARCGEPDLVREEVRLS